MLFTVNTSEQFNFQSLIKGCVPWANTNTYYRKVEILDSLQLPHQNKRYYLRIHLVNQGILNQENGGIPDEQLAEFENGSSEFTDRSLFPF